MTTRVVHLTPSFGCGGLERVIANLVNNSSDDIEHTVISLSDDTSFSHSLPPGVACVSAHKKPGLDPLVHRRVNNIIKKYEATVLHTYNFGTLEHHLSARFAGIKTHIHADHGLGGDHPEGKDKLHNTFRRWVSRYIDHYIVVSDDLRRWATQTVGVSPDKVNFLFNGVEVPPLQTLPRKPTGKLRLVIVGRLAEVKNHQRLFDALKIADTHLPGSVCCDVIGEGPLLKHLTEYVKTLGLTKAITFHGLQTNVRAFIEAADALILSSDYEAMPMTVLEAMAYSRPVICPDVGGVSDFISSEQACIVNGKDTQALAQAIIDHIEKTEQHFLAQVERAHQLVQGQYSVSKMVGKYETLYRASKKTKIQTT